MIETHWHWQSDYPSDLDWQRTRHRHIVSGSRNEALLFTEHRACITLGKRGGQLREKTSTSVYQINRGGLATWHGPGQLVLYPLLHIRRRKLGTKHFVAQLETALLHALLHYDVKAETKNAAPGIWWNNKKLASIGLEIKDGVSMHGCAINLNNSLEGFSEIVPCGFSDVEMITLREIQDTEISLLDFGRIWEKKLRTILRR